MVLDLNEGLGENEHNYRFVGRAGSFCPIKNGKGGGILLREKDGRYYAVQRTKGYRWLESEQVRLLNIEDAIDMAYYEEIAQDAIDAIEKYVSYEDFVKEEV